MMKEKSSLYDKIPLELLTGLFYEIKNNIQKGILSKAMYYEIRLIEKAAVKRGVSLIYQLDIKNCYLTK